MNEEVQPGIFADLYDPYAVRRRNMIPSWIRFFCWLFAILCPLAIVLIIIFSFTDVVNNISVYGLGASDLFSFSSFLVFIFLGTKGAAATGILLEKGWAIRLAIADGIMGAALSVYNMFFSSWITNTTTASFTMTNFHLRFELVFIIPYLVKMVKIRQQWEDNSFVMRGMK